MTLYVCAGLLWLWGVEWLLAHLQIPPGPAGQRRMLSSVALVLVTALGGGWLLWRMRRGEHAACAALAAGREADERQRLAAAVVDNTMEGVVVTDARSRILSVNSAFTRPP
jgi:PAS domain-containing protein